MLDRIIDWASRPKSRRATVIMRITRVFWILVGLGLIAAGLYVGRPR